MRRTTIGISLLGALTMAGCLSRSATWLEGSEDSLQTWVTRSEGTAVALDGLIRGDWVSVYVFGPYTPGSLVRDCVGADVDIRSIDSMDDRELLVLTPRRGPPASVAVKRVDFAEEAYGRPYRPGNATFLVRLDTVAQRAVLMPATPEGQFCKELEHGVTP